MVIIQAVGQIASRKTVSGLVGTLLSVLPAYFDRVYRLNKLGMNILWLL